MENLACIVGLIQLGRMLILPKKGIKKQDLERARDLLVTAVKYGESDFWLDLIDTYYEKPPKTLRDAEEMLVSVAKKGKFEALLDAAWLYSLTMNNY